MIKYLAIAILSSTVILGQVRGFIPFNTNDLSIPIIGLKQTNAVLWATNLGGLIRSSGMGADNVPREITNIVSEVKSVLIYGLDRTGVTNIDAALDTLQKNVGHGASVFFPSGTYKYSNITLTNPISMYGDGSAVIKAADTVPQGFMMTVSGNHDVKISGLIFDGNRAGQNTDATNWFDTLVINSFGEGKVRIFNNTFTNSVMSGLGGAIYGNGIIDAHNNLFVNATEHGGVLGLRSSHIRLRSLGTNVNPSIRVYDNILWQDALHATYGRDPGGAIFDGMDSRNSHPSLLYTGNYHYRVGQTWPIGAANHIGGVDVYEDFKGVNISDNFFIECRYTPIKYQNSGGGIIKGNYINNRGVSVDGGVGSIHQSVASILINPVQRSQTNSIYEQTIVSENIIADGGEVRGIFVWANTESFGNIPSQRVIVENNFVSNNYVGIEIQAMTNFVAVRNNAVFTTRGTNSYTAGIQWTSIKDSIEIKNNFVRMVNGIGLAGTSSNQLADVIVEGNDVETSAAGFYPGVFGPSRELRILSGRWKVPSGGANKSIYLQPNAASDNWGYFEFDALKNYIVTTNTTMDFSYSDIDLAGGILYHTASPESVIPAGLKSLVLRSNGMWYQKRADAGLNTGWSQESAFIDWDTSLEIDNNVTDNVGSGALVFGTLPQFTSGIGIGTPAVSGVAVKYLGNSDAVLQSTFQNSSAGASASMSHVWFNDGSHYMNVGIFGSGVADFGSYGFIQTSLSSPGIRYNTLNGSGVHRFAVAGNGKMFINTSGVNIPNGTAYGAGWIGSTNLANEGEIYSALQNFQPLDPDLILWANQSPFSLTNYYLGFDSAGNKGLHALPAGNTTVFHTTLVASDLTTALTAGGNKAYWRSPTNITLVDIRASLLTGSSAGSVVVDVHATGVTLMTTDKLTIEVSETSTETATTQPALTDTSLANDELVVVEVDSEGANAAGLQVRLYYTIP